MGLLSWIVVGLIAGWLAEHLVHGPRFGLIGATIIGVLGGLVGGFLTSALLHIPDPISGINLTTLLVAFLGSVLLLWVLRFSSRIRV